MIVMVTAPTLTHGIESLLQVNPFWPGGNSSSVPHTSFQTPEVLRSEMAFIQLLWLSTKRCTRS